MISFSYFRCVVLNKLPEMIRFIVYISAILIFATTKLLAQIEAVYIQDRVEITWSYTELGL